MTTRQSPETATEALRIGVSACLLGEAVRFDGNHKRDGFLMEALGPHVTFVPVCPEVGVGMGVPRETVRLQRGEGGARMVAPGSGTDWTDPMRAWAAAKVTELAAADLCGFVLKKDSPSCGAFRVKVYGGPMAERSGVGLFAAALMDAMPLLPVEEEGRLNDPVLREWFVERIFAYRRLRRLFRPGWALGDLVAFHTDEKLALLAHDPTRYRALGRIVAGGKAIPPDALRDAYADTFMRTLAVQPTRGRHTNVLHHMAGHLREHLPDAARRDLDARILEYRHGTLPLIVPLSLISHYVRVHDVRTLASQTYLQPHPEELMLRHGL
ncbi:MAG: hypothetical protein AMXMBFR64_03920 [Myxococcales bacterium]